MSIYIHKDGNELGPYSEQELRLHWANGLFAAEDLAWRAGMEEWVPLKDFFAVPRTPPPAESGVSRDTELIDD